MKTIYINKDILDEALDYLNRDITFYEFLSYTKAFLKQLLSNPMGADIDPFLKENGLTRKELLNSLLEKTHHDFIRLHKFLYLSSMDNHLLLSLIVHHIIHSLAHILDL